MVLHFAQKIPCNTSIEQSASLRQLILRQNRCMPFQVGVNRKSGASHLCLLAITDQIWRRSVGSVKTGNNWKKCKMTKFKPGDVQIV
jgi:hypothetical protein